MFRLHLTHSVLLLLGAVFCSPAFAFDYLVDPSGAAGAYTTIQAALDAIGGQTQANRANVLIAPGTYREQLVVNKPFITFMGMGGAADTVTILSGGTGFSPAVYVQGPATGFMATNLTFQNQILDNMSQGIALRSSADKAAYSDVRFVGYQDTLLIDNNSRAYFKDVFVTGDTDFIYGNATAVFDNATIQSTAPGYITAANTAPTTANGLIFRNATLIAGSAREPFDYNGDPASRATANSVYLGRPWGWPRGEIASAIFIDTAMGSHIRTAGWNPWDLADPGPNTNPDATSRYSEFGSTTLSGTPLALGSNGVPVGRVDWADPMTQAQADLYTLDNIFGPVDFWNSNPLAQPEGTGRTYLPQGDGLAWNPLEQLALLDAIGQPPPPPTGVINFDIGLDSVYSGPGVAPDQGDFWNAVSARNRTGTITLTDVFDSRGNPTMSDIVVSNAADSTNGPLYAYSTAANSNAQPPALMEDYLFRGPYAVQVTDLEPGDYELYVFAHGDQPNQSSTVSLDAANGGATGTTGSTGTEVRNIFTANAEGYAYLRLAGSVGDGATSLGFSTSGYLNGFQLVRLSTEIAFDIAGGTATQADAGHAVITRADAVIKTGSGTIVFNAANSYTGTTTIRSGTLRVTHADALATSPLTVEAGGTLAVADGVLMRSLELSLVGGLVDLGAGGILVAAGGFEAADLRAAIVAGRHGGDWAGTSGITSATARDNPATRAVGYLLQADGSALVSLAAPGDADLNGAVSVFDLVSINSAGGYGTGTASDWSKGDFTYDGVTNVFDLVAVNTAGMYGSGRYTTPSLGAAATTAVPEPSAWLLLATATFFSLGVPRKRP